MIKIANAQLWVHDQDEALAFYTQKLGFEVQSDVTLAEMGDFRWLAVGPAGQDVSIVLMAIPGQPVMDSETGDQVRALMAKGFAGTVFLTTEDCRASYEELKGRGVEFVEEPEERPYGIDAGLPRPVWQPPAPDAGPGGSAGLVVRGRGGAPLRRPPSGVRTCVRALRRAPLPLGLLLPRRGVAPGGAGGRGGRAGPPSPGPDRPRRPPRRHGDGPGAQAARSAAHHRRRDHARRRHPSDSAVRDPRGLHQPVPPDHRLALAHPALGARGLV